MSTRNPMNPRYTEEDAKPVGVAKKSASKAKPKSKAAYSVKVESRPKTADERKKAQRDREKVNRREYNDRLAAMGTPDNPEYKKYRRIWWILWGVAVAAVVIAWVASYQFPSHSNMTIPILIVSYVAVAAAIILDVRKIRPFRKAQQQAAARPMSNKERKKYEKAKAEAEAEAEAKKAARKESRSNFLSFGKKKEKAADTADAAEEAEQAGEEASKK